MKVLLVEYFGRGGIAHYTHCLAQAVAELKVDTTLCTGESYEFDQLTLPYQFRRVFNIYGSEDQSKNSSRSKFAKGIGYLQGLQRLGQVVKEISPDVVHIQSSSLLPLAELGLLIWLSRRIPLVYTIHNLLPHEPRVHHRLTYKRIYGLPRALIVHGGALQADLRQQFAPSAGVHVIPHGEYSFLSRPEDAPSRSGARRWLGLATGSPLILFFGSIRPYKGLDTLLEALPEVLADVPETRTWVVGKPLRDFDLYQDQIDRLGLSNRVRTVLEYVPQEHIPYYFAAADVVAAPYKQTYQSGVIQLAYAAARPVVTTSTGALPEVVEDGRSGLLVPSNDSHALARALTHLLGNPQVAARMGEYGQYLAKTRYSWDLVAKQTIAVYKEVLGRP